MPGNAGGTRRNDGSSRPESSICKGWSVETSAEMQAQFTNGKAHGIKRDLSHYRHLEILLIQGPVYSGFSPQTGARNKRETNGSKITFPFLVFRSIFIAGALGGCQRDPLSGWLITKLHFPGHWPAPAPQMKIKFARSNTFGEVRSALPIPQTRERQVFNQQSTRQSLELV